MQYSDNALDEDLTRLTGAWADLQSSRARDAVYSFLTIVFDTVEWWTVDGKVRGRAQSPRILHDSKCRLRVSFCYELPSAALAEVEILLKTTD